MKEIKLIALDMDGTLFNHQGEISEKDRETLKRATKAGVAVAVATGRAYTELPIEMLYEVGIRYAITGNGSGIYKLPDQECVFRDCLDLDTTCEILDELKKLDVYYDVYIEGIAYCPKSTKHIIQRMDMHQSLKDHVEKSRIAVDDLSEFVRSTGKGVEKTTVNFALLEDGTYLDKDETTKLLDRYPQIQYLCGGYANWEFTKAGVTKGSGLHFLAERIGVPMECTMACGDSENDYFMLKEASFSVAMENAAQGIKDICDYITLSNEESGVAAAIEKFVFGE